MMLADLGAVKLHVAGKRAPDAALSMSDALQAAIRGYFHRPQGTCKQADDHIFGAAHAKPDLPDAPLSC